MRAHWLLYRKLFFIGLCFALLVRFLWISVLYMPTAAMGPSIEKGDYLLGYRWAYSWTLPIRGIGQWGSRLPKRGDLVSFHFPGDEEQILVRRVVGLPGDSLEIKNGKLWVGKGKAPASNETEKAMKPQVNSSKPCGEEKLGADAPGYVVCNDPSSSFDLFKVPKGGVFVLVDDRRIKDDSRTWGIVPLELIQSRISFIIGSKEQGGFIKNRERFLKKLH